MDTGNTQHEIDDTELTDEQLQRLGIEEYPDEPTWVRGRTATEVALGNAFNEEFMQHWIERFQEANNQRVRAMVEQENRRNRSTSRLVFGGNPIEQDAYFGQTHQWQVIDEVASLEMINGTHVASNADGLNINSPTYANLEEMRALLETDES